MRNEMTVRALLLGMLLAVVMGAANAYLGLKAGMTVSASIPAAVIAVGIFRGLLRRPGILEANLVQTAASTGESLAAGIIFTVPALVMTQVWQQFNFWQTTLIGMIGGSLGVLLMIPMRRVFVVNSPELPFPEGIACAEVLETGSRVDGDRTAVQGLRLIFGGLLFGAMWEFTAKYLGLLLQSVEGARRIGGRIFYLGSSTSPSLLAVGVIVGLPIAAQVFLGGVIGSLIGIPLLSADTTQGTALDGSIVVWKQHVRYIGVGTMLVGGVMSIWRVRRGLISAARELSSQFKAKPADFTNDPRDQDMPHHISLGLLLLTVVVMGGLFYVLLDHALLPALVASACALVMAFFFTAVASYIVGLVGNSNSPVSGMAITALLGTALVMFAMKLTGPLAVLATLSIAGVVCCAACTAGDICNDLKAGHMVGASPRNQQIFELLSLLVTCFIMAPILTTLNNAHLADGGLGGKSLPAPQAQLMATLVKALFIEGQLPWRLIGYGAVIGALLVLIDTVLAFRNSNWRLHVMPVAVGIYLPLTVTMPILLGGLLSAMVTGRGLPGTHTKRTVLLASGLIAGEALMGISVALATESLKEVAWATWARPLELSQSLGDRGALLLTVAAMVAMGALFLWVGRRRREDGVQE